MTDQGLKELQARLEARYGRVKLISVRGNSRAIIVKTTNEVAPLLRSQSTPLLLDGRRVVPVLTSGAVGNLKRRALEARPHGQVPE